MADKKTGEASTAGAEQEAPNTGVTSDTTQGSDSVLAPPAPDGGVVEQAQVDKLDDQPADDVQGDDVDADAELGGDAGLVASIADLPAVADDDKATQRDAKLVQFPSTVGQPEVEVAERTTDTTKTSTNVHRKTFVLTAEQYNARGFDHLPNINATRQFMLDYGLRPVGDVKFVGSEKHRDGVSVKLHYEGQAIPAVVATAPSVNHAVVAQG